MKKLFALSFLLLFSCSNQKDFDSSEWKNWVETEDNLNLRWEMRCDLLDKHDLKKYNKPQILDLLGKPDFENESEFRYNLGYSGNGINTGSLIIFFKNDFVIEYKIIDG